ncbi:MAG: hypothetical protein LBQ48_00130, partial [Oscillospiraceae bacterium]|nr:hypothetical protein [Oscillospiraceae bacterium]
MQKKQIANVIFFVRAVEPRDPNTEKIMPKTVEKQIDLVRHYGFPASFLLQYDAFIRPDYISLIKTLPENCEVGGWFEVVQPLVEKAGLRWRGRPGFAWDWHPDVGFSVGYTPPERLLLVDVFMAGFKERFGHYPHSVGSWLIDAVTLAYMADHYGLEASSICRDQWGTDGYNLWGGYWGQGYYPCRNNVLCPAQTKKAQISVPTFRMLGSDPIYQYDLGLCDGDDFTPSGSQGVVTLEPVYGGSGGNPRWVDWYLGENFKESVTFGYTQIGQENSFGWESMKNGLLYQFEALAKLNAAGKVSVQTLCDTGKWYKANFPLTTVTSASGLTDWQERGRQSLWFDSRFYRANFYGEDGRVWLRDIHKFDENYRERYFSSV